MTTQATAPFLADLAARSKARLESAGTTSHFTDEEAEALYGMAFQLAQQGKHEEALRQFVFLVSFRPTTLKYLQALAVTHRELGHFQEAIGVYRVMDTLEPCNPKYVLAMAECHLHLDRRHIAQDLLEQVIEFCETGGAGGPVLERARAMRALVQPREDHAAAQ